jgi:hypothetical protein
MHLLAAAAFFLAAAISNHPQLYLLLWLLAKYSISTSFTGLFVYGSEYFPTAKRNICMGICATVSQAFSIFTPSVIRLVVRTVKIQCDKAVACEKEVYAFSGKFIPRGAHALLWDCLIVGVCTDLPFAGDQRKRTARKDGITN